MDEYLKKRMLSIMLCANWLCAGSFVDHEWMSESTISQHEEENLAMQMDHGLDVPCMVQWSLLWLYAPARLNKILGLELKIKKKKTRSCQHYYHGRYCTTIRRCMLTSVARVLHRTHKKWRVNKEMEGWMARGSVQPSSSGDDEDDESGDE